MIRAIMHGASGHMGAVVTDICREDSDIEIVAGVALEAGEGPGYTIYSSLEDVKEQADVIIDFSGAPAVDALLDYMESRGVPAVICTTGLSEEQVARIDEVSQKTAILRSANMSLGINTLMELLKKATDVFVPAGFDVEIVEKHHNQKLDAPSGTAIALADSVNEAAGDAFEYVYDRSQVRRKRDKKELGISAVRAGTIVGEHDVIFAGTDEVITFTHTAYSKAIFAKGAVSAAKFLAGKDKGLYDMADVIRAS
ncbi:MAG: 4-hydroxy-tetrahydrodipicolinate reductase [Eubacterium sp.]|nr:4-hydroxy-tetrahydrodipicolinate reductase [Eubacterium sp.]